ncbi:MAG: anthranilate phosphoribosyltransferase [Hydrogenothermaceae bacterium]|nr:anthranilate phosphoribosyltransferase [Hydrogenothermaceae bacterium]
MIKEYINKLVNREDLSAKEMEDLFNNIMEGNLTDAQIGAILIALKMKGESIEEIVAATKVMREKAVKVEVKDRSKLVDTCGTGGDKVDTFNVSTISAFVVAASGGKVAKHGNRSVSSKCGSADIMQALGVNIEMSPEKVAESIEKIGLGFLFAPIFHPAMKNVIKQRREIGVRTIFNILGPLSNPAKTDYQLIGVYDENLVKPITEVLKELGLKRAYVVHGLEGLDEVSITTKTLVGKLNNGEIDIFTVEPEDFGLKKADLKDLEGGDIEINKKIALDILTGQDRTAKTDFVALNSAFSLHLIGVVDSIKEGIELAKESIYSKKAYEVLEKLRNFG